MGMNSLDLVTLHLWKQIDLQQAEKLKSREMKEGWMKNDEGWMKNDEGWMKNDEWWRMMFSSC